MRITELLLEYDRAITLQKFSSAITPAATQEKLTAEQAIEALEQMDPTPNKQYVPWLAKQFIAKQFRIEEANRVKELLTNFVKLKPRLPAEQRDLGRFDFNKLSEIVNSTMNPEVGSTATSDAGIFPVVPNSEVLYNGPYGQLSIPKTEKASCELGRGTKWCTSASKDNQFDNYNERGPLYVWKDRDGSKWQFHFDSSSFHFMDAGNESINRVKLNYFRTEHPVVKKLFRQEEKTILRDPEAVVNYAQNVIQSRWPEAESIILTNPQAAAKYAPRVIKGRWPEAESIIIQDPQAAHKYAQNVIKGRWPEAESIIAQNPQAAFDYAYYVIKDRWAEGEKAIAQRPGLAVFYAQHVIRGRWPEGEKAIAQDPYTAYMYANSVIKGRWPEGESVIAQDPYRAAGYAANVINGRWPEAESVIARDPEAASGYAYWVIKGRWPEAEPVIARDPNTAAMYKRNFGINLRQ